MISLIIQTIKQKMGSLIAFSGISTAFLFMYVAIFPTFAKEQDKMAELMKIYPEEMFKAFNIPVESFSHMTVESFVAMEHLSIIWPIMAIALIAGFAGSALAGEVERKTIELLLSQPISRVKLYFAKYLGALGAFLIFLALSFLMAVPYALVLGIDFKIEHFLNASLLALAFGLALMGIAFLASAVFSEKGKVSMVVGGITALMYVLNVLASLVKDAENLKYVSFFYYFDGNKALIKNEYDLTAYIVFLSVAVVCTFLGAVVFKKRDV